jgi:hypothetical protein
METYTIEGARLLQIDTLMSFYTTDERDTLPAPSYGDLKEALRQQSLLTVTKADDGAVAATAGYFEYARSDENSMIYELAGTRVKNNIGRLKEISLQQILLSLRIIQVVVTEAGPVGVISSAKSSRSIENLISLAMEEILPKPAWFEFDTCSWTRMEDRPKWKHFAATMRSVDEAIKILVRTSFSKGNTSVLLRKNKRTALTKSVRSNSYLS